MELNSIINKHPVQDIEKALVLCYLNKNNIAVSNHPYLADYLNGFCPSSELIEDITSIKYSSLAELAVDMELLIPEEDRETNGAFFTPPHIVDYIINTANPAKSASVIDISCGCGAFLLGAIRYFVSKFNKTIAEIVRDNVFGIDLLDYNVRRAKLLILLYGLSRGEIINESEIHIKTANSLTYSWHQKYDVIIGNPPYVKFQDMEDKTRNLLEQSYKTTGYGNYNLYFAFFELGYNLLKEGGVLGYITPNNYFTSLSGEGLRDYFQKTKSVSKIVDFNSTKVFDVQTYTALTFLTKKVNDVIDYARISKKESIKHFLSNLSFSANNYEDLSSKKWRLLCGEEREIINTIESFGEPIGRLFNIAVGIATLKDEAFFVSPYSEDDKYFYCNNKYKTGFKIEKLLTRPYVKISSIKTPADLDSNKNRIIFPYSFSNGMPTPLSEVVMKEQYPAGYAYLESIREILASRGKGKHEYTPFYAYGRSQGLNKVGPKIYTPTFSQYPRFILDSNQSSLFSNGYGIFYREHEGLELFNRINPIQRIENSDVLLKVLNSGLMHYYVSKTSVSIEGGYPCYQKNFIEKFCIPNLSEEEISELRCLEERDDIDNYLLSIYQIKKSRPNLWE